MRKVSIIVGAGVDWRRRDFGRKKKRLTMPFALKTQQDGPL